MNLDDQRDTIERALGERMINHCLTILKVWIAELGVDTYANRFHSIGQNYRYLFNYYLSTDDPERERLLDEMTGEAYRLVDDVFADVCLKRGRVKEYHGFDRTSHTSVMHYFSECMRLQDEDLDWLCDTIQDEQQSAMALLAVAAISANLKGFFQEDALLALIQCMDCEQEVLRNQICATVLMLLVHYDVRIDFFPKVKEAFVQKIGTGDDIFEMLCGFIHSTTVKLQDLLKSKDFDSENIPSELKNLLQSVQENGEVNLEEVANWVPNNENEYLAGLIAILPQTWVYSAIVGEDEERAERLAHSYLDAGMLDLMWDHLDIAEKQLVEQLRSDKVCAQDYLNYAHICFIKGDRVMAYENYKQARQMVGSSRKFFSLFRPDRGILVSKGVPVEQVYLMEDQLLRIEE